MERRCGHEASCSSSLSLPNPPFPPLLKRVLLAELFSSILVEVFHASYEEEQGRDEEGRRPTKRREGLPRPASSSWSRAQNSSAHIEDYTPDSPRVRLVKRFFFLNSRSSSAATPQSGPL
ncbi:hypothetical protein HPB50_000273 [Hyalomma asiaticum]|uniref:Uncharacterized protein n=1 Tax=Hyalomma asiaticum TaxID=266040 RepID=A0ACB7S5X9_HYAAI|nr:hypothetical protein HPB50_000273 [Hyalomma asiaticum]